MTKKQVKKVDSEPEGAKEVEQIEEVILAAGAARQRKQEDAGAASAAFDIEELQYYKKLFEDIYKDFQELGI